MSQEPFLKPVAANREPTPQLSPLGIAVVCFGVVNLLGPPAVVSTLSGPGDDSSFVLLAIGGGILISQFGVLPAWLVWGEHSFWLRLLVHWALAMGLWMAWWMGLAMAATVDRSGPPPEELFRVMTMTFLCLPAVSLGIETPLWITRLFFGWRIGRPEADANRRPLAISDFLWGMAIISVALAAVRVAGAIDPWQGPSAIWAPVAMTAGSAALASLLVMLPLTWCILRLKDVGAGIVAIMAYTFAAGIVILAIIGAMGGRMGNDARPVVALFLFLGSVAATISAVLGLARGAGYRLLVGHTASAIEPAVSEDKTG